MKHLAISNAPGFTPHAKKLAEGHGVILIDRGLLADWPLYLSRRTDD